MIEFRVFGVPAPQGSKNAGVKKNGRAFVYDQGAAKLHPWRQDISDAGAKIMDGRSPLDGPLFCDLTFFVHRPAKPSFKDYPATPYDLDKLTRGVYDALKFAQVIKDDARIVEGHGRKRFADSPDDLGVLVRVMSMAEWTSLAS